jgi:hypothetical protein
MRYILIVLIVFNFFLIIKLTASNVGDMYEVNHKIAYVKKKYEHTLYGQECLFYPAKNPKRMLISFCGAMKNIYSMWSWFWLDSEDWQETAYLFLKDETFSWYLGNDTKSLVDDYIHIIKYFMDVAQLHKDQVFTVGRSMGGYAAIYYATILGLKGAIALNTQVDKESAITQFSQVSYTFGIANTENQWVDLDMVVAQYDKVPSISLNCGSFIRDKLAAHKLLNTLKEKNSLVIFRKTPLLIHSPFGCTKKFIENEINFMEMQEPVGINTKI